MVKISKISDENLEKIKGGNTISVWTGIAVADYRWLDKSRRL